MYTGKRYENGYFVMPRLPNMAARCSRCCTVLPTAVRRGALEPVNLWHRLRAWLGQRPGAAGRATRRGRTPPHPDDVAAGLLHGQTSQQEFLAMFSHDVRSPLQAIVGYASLLDEELRESGDEAARTDVQHILGAASYLLALASGYLDAALLESGQVAIVLGAVPVLSVTSRALAIAQPLAHAKGLAVTSDIDLQCRFVLADDVRLIEILTNLLTNAITYAQRGEIALLVSPEVDGVRFAVRDVGPGLPDAVVRWINAGNPQANQSPPATSGRSGLGLVIVRRLLALHSSRLEAESKRGGGTTFSFVLPDASGASRLEPPSPVAAA